MIKFFRDFVTSHFHFGVSRSSANLAYFLLFSFFPMLIFFNSLLGIINMSPETVDVFLKILPDEIEGLITDYLLYISTGENIFPLFFGLGLTIYSFARCVNSLFYTLNDIYGVVRPKKSMFLAVFFTTGLILSVYLLIILVVAGGTIISLVARFFDLPADILSQFHFLRYLISIGYFFFVFLLLYRFIPKVKHRFLDVLPGTMYAMLGIFIISIGFSIYVEYFSNYSLIYGSLSTIMILMFWLYLASMVIIQGSIINKLIYDRRHITD